MSILSRVLTSPGQRWDLEDLNGLLSDLRTDAKLHTKSFLSGINTITSGFIVQGLGLNEATILMADAALLLPQNTFDFSYFIAPPVPTNITVTDAELTDGSRNFLELSLQTVDGTPLSRAFWDQNASAGQGAEFLSVVNTVRDLQAVVTILPGGFSGSIDSIPLAIIDVSPAGQIQTIFDRRPMFGRLALPTDLANEFAWGTKIEPAYSLTMSGVVGVFISEETLTIGAETATVTVGGGTPITFREPSGVNFFPGNAVTGGTSGAVGTILTVEESFVGVDKDLADVGTILKAIQTEIKLIKGTPQWYTDAGATLSSTSVFLNSVMVQSSLNANFSWNGTNLTITDNATIPATGDVMAFLRQMGVGTDLALTRQSSGQELQTITFSNVPDAGSLTLEHNGDVSLAINPSDDASDVQSAVNATWASTVTVTGTFVLGFSIFFDGTGDAALITEQANSLTSSTTPVTTTIAETQRGYVGGATIPIGADQVLFIDVPTIGGRTYSDVGVGATNYQVVNRSAFVSTATNYWIAFNQSGILYLRGMGELEPGESTPISDPDKETILSLINAQNVRVNEDRGIQLTEGGTWSVVGNVLTNSATADVLIPGLDSNFNQIAAQSITFPSVGDVAFIPIDRGAVAQSFRSPSVLGIEDVPVSDNIYVYARRTSLGILVG